jgi:hypothetical protein
MTSISAFLYEEDSLGIFLLVSVVLGGGAAALTGRAIALTWRPRWHIVVAMIPLGGAVRFIHFALFGGTLISLHYYLVDTAICIGFAATGFRAARAAQLVTQYRWLYRPNGWLRWRRKPP